MTYAFSDGNIYKEFAVFLATFLTILVIFSQKSLRAYVENLLFNSASFVIRKKAFDIYDSHTESCKLDLIRILVGFLASFRYGDIFILSIQGSLHSSPTLISGLAFFAAILITIGFFTPLACFLLMASGNILIDNMLGSSTLGSMVLSMILLCFVLTPAGTTLSLDHYLISNNRVFGRALSSIYSFTGLPNDHRIVLAKFFTAFSYWLVCLYSVCLHLNDTAWMSGYALSWVLLSPDHDPLIHELIYDLYKAFPAIFIFTTKTALYGMIVWYFTFLPGLFLGKCIKRVIIVWSFLFWIISAFILPLSYLGWYELYFGMILFLGHPFVLKRREDSIQIFYDDRCRLCDKTVWFLSKTDILGILTFKSIRKDIEIANSYGITLEAGLTDIVAYNPITGRKLVGYELYDYICGVLILLLPLKPLTYLGRISGIGKLVYEYISRRRIKLFGVCEPSTLKIREFFKPIPQSVNFSLFFISVSTTLVILSITFIVRLPYAGDGSNDFKAALISKDIFGSASLAFGVGAINVFNTQDLELMYFKSKFLVNNSPVANFKEIRFSDVERYGISAFLRQNSRMNLSCNRYSLEQMLSKFSRYKNEPHFKNGLTTHITYRKVPTASDFDEFKFVPIKEVDLCRVDYDLHKNQIINLELFQEGIDEVMLKKGHEQFLTVYGAKSVGDFPCEIEQKFLSNYYDKLSESSLDGVSAELNEAIKNMNTVNYGEFNLECLVKVRRVNSLIGNKFSPSLGRDSNSLACSELLKLADKYKLIIPNNEMLLLIQKHTNLPDKFEDSLISCDGPALEIREVFWRSVDKKFAATQ